VLATDKASDTKTTIRLSCIREERIIAKVGGDMNFSHLGNCSEFCGLAFSLLVPAQCSPTIFLSLFEQVRPEMPLI
jgi:hypothetical protein